MLFMFLPGRALKHILASSMPQMLSVADRANRSLNFVPADNFDDYEDYPAKYALLTMPRLSLLRVTNEVRFSPERGFFNATFTLTLKPPKRFGNNFINYMISYKPDDILSWKPLSDSFGLNYTGPITIKQSCVVSAISYYGESGAITNVTTHTYIFIADVIKQPKMNQTFVDSEKAANILQVRSGCIMRIFVCLFFFFFTDIT
jgi:hypothetical protein